MSRRSTKLQDDALQQEDAETKDYIKDINSLGDSLYEEFIFKYFHHKDIDFLKEVASKVRQDFIEESIYVYEHFDDDDDVNDYIKSLYYHKLNNFESA